MFVRIEIFVYKYLNFNVITAALTTIAIIIINMLMLSCL